MVFYAESPIFVNVITKAVKARFAARFNLGLIPFSECLGRHFATVSNSN